MQRVVVAAPAADRPHVMRQKLIHVIAALSLLLCLTTCGLWVRSHWRGDSLAGNRWALRDNHPRFSAQMFASSRGRIKVAYLLQDHFPLVRQDVRPTWRWYLDSNSNPGEFPDSNKHLGFNFNGYWKAHSTSDEGSADSTRAEILCPHWFAAVLFAGLPAWSFSGRWRRLRRERRAVAGRCPTCGYDLRATPERCPECGAVPGAIGTAA